MTGFEEREKDFEAGFHHEQELAFKVTARRNMLLGRWAARHLGLEGADAETYASQLVAAALDRHGAGDVVIGTVARDFAAKGVAIAEPRIADELRRLEDEAKRQLQRE